MSYETSTQGLQSFRIDGKVRHNFTQHRLTPLRKRQDNIAKEQINVNLFSIHDVLKVKFSWRPHACKIETGVQNSSLTFWRPNFTFKF